MNYGRFLILLVSIQSLPTFARNYHTTRVNDESEAPAAGGFAGPCFAADKSGKAPEIVISAAGDLIAHSVVQDYAKKCGSFETTWSETMPLVAKANLSYVNFESAIDPSRAPSGYPNFNFDPSVVGDLKKCGFDICSTANNHALDCGVKGANGTVETFKKVGLDCVGTCKAGERSLDGFYKVTKVKGKNIAWIACTQMTNGIPDAGKQVMYCDESVAQLVKKLKADSSIDGIIVTPHWGEEYETRANASQKSLAKTWAEAGATAIIGSHPHVVQPSESITTSDGRNVLVHYSLGNFVSNNRMNGVSRSLTSGSVFLYLGLSTGAHGKLEVSGVRYVPLQMEQGPDAWKLHTLDPANLSPEMGKMFSNVIDPRLMVSSKNAPGFGKPCIP